MSTSIRLGHVQNSTVKSLLHVTLTTSILAYSRGTHVGPPLIPQCLPLPFTLYLVLIDNYTYCSGHAYNYRGSCLYNQKY